MMELSTEYAKMDNSEIPKKQFSKGSHVGSFDGELWRDGFKPKKLKQEILTTKRFITIGMSGF